jgi:hypothetical protein
MAGEGLTGSDKDPWELQIRGVVPRYHRWLRLDPRLTTFTMGKLLKIPETDID